MGKPKSFKDLFKYKKQVPMHGGNLIIAPKPIKPDPDFLAQQAKQQKELEKFVNQKRCSVCGSQLDGPVYAAKAELYCVAYNSHYKCTYLFDNKLPKSSLATYAFDQNAYEIYSRLKDIDKYYIEVYKIDLNLIPKFQQRDKKKIMDCESAIFKFQKNISEEDFLQKIKLYTVFS